MAVISGEDNQLEAELHDNLAGFIMLSCLKTGPRRRDALAEEFRQIMDDIDEQAVPSIIDRLQNAGLLCVRNGQSSILSSGEYNLTDRGAALVDRFQPLLADSLRSLAESRPAQAKYHRDRGSVYPWLEQSEALSERVELERLRADLLSTISHELRTPLTLIRTSIGLLLDGNPDQMMRERLLLNIKQSTDRMHSLVTDLLDLARLESGRAELQIRYVDIGELVQAAATLMKPMIDEKSQVLEIAISAPPRVMGDFRRLEQVLLNLLSNASKFAPRGSELGIRAMSEKGEAIIAVSDTGPGISLEAQMHLFERFYTDRTSSPSNLIGAGLGLPIAKGIVEAHRGHMWVSSTVGVGSTFYFSLPQEGPLGEGADEDTGG